MAATRTEHDSMGEMEVPAKAYYGAQTQRAARNFQISNLRFPREFIRAMALIKKAAARVNMELGLLDPELGAPIVHAAQAVAEGKHDDQFVLDVFQTGSGTSTNMNTNEVIAGIAYNLLESIDLLTTASEHLAAKCIDAERFLAGRKAVTVRRVEADEVRCRQLIEKSLAMSTALAPRIGYDSAAAISKTAYPEGKTIREVAMELLGLGHQEVAARLGPPASADVLEKRGGFPTREEVDQLLDPRAQTIRGTGIEGPTG